MITPTELSEHVGSGKTLPEIAALYGMTSPALWALIRSSEELTAALTAGNLGSEPMLNWRAEIARRIKEEEDPEEQAKIVLAAAVDGHIKPHEARELIRIIWHIVRISNEKKVSGVADTVPTSLGYFYGERK